MRIHAERRDSQFQELHLTEPESVRVAEVVFEAISERARQELLVKLLATLTRAKFLRILALDLRRRVRLPKER